MSVSIQRIVRLASALTVAALVASPASAQSNGDPSIDVKLGVLGAFNSVGRSGTFPNGMNAAAMSTTVCNQGAVVPWMAAMDPEHPLIAFLVTREANGRFHQISDRSFLKHGFFALTSSQCTPCTPPGGGAGNFLGLGCSDTYSISNNGDDFWLAPADEIDPWLGAWDPNCSFFDLGTGGAICDSLRSFTQSQANALGPVGNRIHLSDAVLNAGGSYWYQAQYVVATEMEGVREDNLGSRPFTPSWTGSSWNLAESGSLLEGSVLQRWSGAQVTSGANGGDDGRVYIATTVSGPSNGLYHYEIAVHNRDNFRGIDEFRIPLCPGARVLNAGFSDIDEASGNDWTNSIQSGGAELVYQGDATSALRWNTIYNFWFDSDAAPSTLGATLVQADAGTGAASFDVDMNAPAELYNVYAGPGCSLDGTPPTLYGAGTPPRASLGNATFELISAGNVPGQLNFLVATNTAGPGSTVLGCTFWMPGPIDQLYGFATVTTDGSGNATYALAIPNDPVLEGADLRFQAIGINPGAGGVFNSIDFSDGVEVRAGSSIQTCQ